MAVNKKMTPNTTTLPAMSIKSMLAVSTGPTFPKSSTERPLRREDAELAAAAAALEQAEQTLEEVEDALEEGVDPETLKDRIDAAQQAVDVAQEAVEDAQDVVEDMLEHFDRGDDDRKEERRGD